MKMFAGFGYCSPSLNLLCILDQADFTRNIQINPGCWQNITIWDHAGIDQQHCKVIVCFEIQTYTFRNNIHNIQGFIY